MISKDAQSRTCTHNYRKALYRITRMRTTKNSNECSVRVTTETYTDAIAMNFFQTTSLYYTYMILKDIQVGTKLTRW